MTHAIPSDYAERVYAGWLGKCIGVRFGAPVEGWTYDEIMQNLGEIDGYVREDRVKLFKPDDDTSVPMILIRAFEDYGVSPEMTPQQVANTLLNYLSDQAGTLWWGGYGISTEHTAYVNLANGIPAPRSGSIEQNGPTMAEQIGGQIFSDIWGLIAPNNPRLAADLAQAAASVTHDGNGMYGGRFIAALVSAAFSEDDPLKLIEIGLRQIPPECDYTQVVRAMIDFYVHAEHKEDWHAAYAYLKSNFGYDRYPGEVHIIPNAGVIALGLLYGEGDFSRTICITNICGWDTDCNVGNVGAILGVAAGVDGIETKWRDPMNDLLVTASNTGTRNLLTIPQCSDIFVRIGRELYGDEPGNTPARYHFNYPGSTNNFIAEGEGGRPIHLTQTEIAGKSALRMAVRKFGKKGEMRLYTRTFYEPSELISNYYGATFTPLIHPGQTITAQIYIPEDAPDTLKAGIYVRDLNHDGVHQMVGDALTPGEWHTLTYTVPALTDACLSEVGIKLRNVGAGWTTGAVYLSELDWHGAPDYTTTFAHERQVTGTISQWTRLRGYWRLEEGACAGSGPGVNELYTGDINWNDYRIQVELTPVLGDHHTINVRVQGALRGYATGLGPDNRLVFYKNDHGYTEVASAPFDWNHGKTYTITATAQGNSFTVEASGDGASQTLTWQDTDNAYLNGQLGLSTWHGGHTRYSRMTVSPVE